MAEVFRARDEQTGRRVAVKVLHPDVANNPEAVARTRREGQLLSELDNPAIVNVEAWGELDDGSVFLVMELLDGETLGARMRRGPLEPTELAPIVAGTCAGLHAAHAKGVVHRDLKPDNIFLCPTPHGLQVKLLDFGISKLSGGERLTQTGEVLGTPRYMSPEQLGAEPDIDARADVYALGVMLYEALAGQPPFLATTPTDLIIAILNGKVAPLRAVKPDVPEAVESVVLRAMSRSRAARYETSMALAEAFIDAVGGVGVVRQQQRRGLPTQAIGGLVTAPQGTAAPQVPETNPPPPPDEPVERSHGKLELGTFSGLTELPKELRAGEPGVGTHEMGASAGGAAAPDAFEPQVIEPEEDSFPGSARPERPVPQTRLQPMPQIPTTPVPGEARVTAPTAAMEATNAPMHAPLVVPHAAAPATPVVAPPPRRWARGLLVVAALLAGAASAALVIAALTWHDDAPAEDAPAPEAVEEPAADEPEAPPQAPTEPAIAEPEAEAPEPEAQAPEPEPEPVAEPTPARRRRTTRRRTRTPDDPAEEPDEPATDDSPAGLIRRAHTALRGGRAAECVSILDRAIAGGAPAIALRRRGQCYERMGRRDLAIADYRRFCRIAHDHPAISEVRPTMESWGHSCP